MVCRLRTHTKYHDPRSNGLGCRRADRHPDTRTNFVSNIDNRVFHFLTHFVLINPMQSRTAAKEKGKNEYFFCRYLDCKANEIY